MKFTLVAGLLAAATSIHAISTCPKGSQAINVIRTASFDLATILCKGLSGTFDTTSGDDKAQVYLAQLKEHAKCGKPTSCFATCRISVEDNLTEALNTVLGEQKTICEASGGSYSTIFLAGL